MDFQNVKILQNAEMRPQAINQFRHEGSKSTAIYTSTILMKQ